MVLKVYEYDKCISCKNALKFLEKHKIPFEAIPIVDKPPSKAELKKMLDFYNNDIKRLFNTSGQLYKEMNMSEKLGAMTNDQALDLLSQHGKLIKRPFALNPDAGVVGFKETEWKEKIT